MHIGFVRPPFWLRSDVSRACFLPFDPSSACLSRLGTRNLRTHPSTSPPCAASIGGCSTSRTAASAPTPHPLIGSDQVVSCRPSSVPMRKDDRTHRKPSLDVRGTIDDRSPIAAREAAKHRKAKGLRKPVPIELRPASVQHSYRYQLHRREPA